jgi:hypothetical protein
MTTHPAKESMILGADAKACVQGFKAIDISQTLAGKSLTLSQVFPGF